MSDVYYRLYVTDDISIVAMQIDDERDYDQSQFLTERRFGSEGEAQAWLDDEIERLLRLLPIILRHISVKAAGIRGIE
jgi:hypothetical protein